MPVPSLVRNPTLPPSLPRRLFLIAVAGLCAASGAAQELETSILLDDSDPTSADNPFGLAFDPDGRHAYVPLAGNLSFLPPPGAGNNDNVVKVDVRSGVQVAVGSTGLYPEEAVVALDAFGAPRHVYVSASTDGVVNCLTPDLSVTLAAIPVSPCFGSVFFGAFPYGLALSADQTRLYVTTQGGCDLVDVLDVDPLSPTFNQLVDTFVVPGAGGRPSWRNATELVIPVAIPAPDFLTAQAGVAIVDVAAGGAYVVHPLTPPGAPGWHYANEALVVQGDKAILPLFGGATATIFEVDLATGGIVRTFVEPPTVAGVRLHGLAASPDGSTLAVTSLTAGKTLFVDYASFTTLAVYDHGGGMPNEAAFTPDGSRLAVTLQGAARVDVLKDLPGFDLRLDAPTSIAQNATLQIHVRRVEEGAPFAVFYSATGGPTVVGPFVIGLGLPFFELFSGIGAADGTGHWSLFIPSAPFLTGLPVHFQAGTVDRDGDLRLSNAVAAVLQ